MIMKPLLNEDVFTVIYSHTFDFDVLRATATAVSSHKQHPLRAVVLRRLLQLPLRLSSDHLDDSKDLIDHFVRNDARASLVRDIVVVLAPRNWPRYRVKLSEVKGAENANVLMGLLPQLFGRTENLRRLDWSRFPSPSGDILKELLDHSLITHLSIECAVDSQDFRIPDLEPLDATSLEIKLLLSIIGPKVTSLDFRSVDERTFETIAEDLPPLENIHRLKLDLTCGVWDWDGAGSPQLGPSEQYTFPCISEHVREFDIKITDLLARQPRGPIELVDPTRLTKLRVEVTPYTSWTTLAYVRLFSSFTAADFSCLTHLIIDDTIRDMRRWTIGDTMRNSDWDEDGRTYAGIPELVQSLPRLRHFWVNERVLAVPSSENEDHRWDIYPFDGDSQDTIMSRTVASSQWQHLGCAFERLETLRVGFGPLNASWATEVLSLCDRTKLSAFGFDWNWRVGSNEVAFSELIVALSKFESLTDLHILHPYAALPGPIDYNDEEKMRKEVRFVHENEVTVELAKMFLSSLPGLYRVGVGRNSVWERQTRFREDGVDGLVVQRLDRTVVPSFYDAGSSLPEMDQVEYDDPPAIKDVYKLLEQL